MTRDTSKVAIASLLAMAVGFGFAYVVAKTLNQEFFCVSRHCITQFSKRETPTIFYAYIAFMAALAGLFFAVSAGLWHRGVLRKTVIQWMDVWLETTPGFSWRTMAFLVVIFSVAIAAVALFATAWR